VKQTTEIVKLEPVSTDLVTPMSMLDRAVSSGASVEILEKLMGLQERWDTNQALRSYNDAIAKARAEIPVILKSNEKTGQGGSYKYEDLGTIARIVDPILSKHGLSYRFKSESNGEVKVSCVISHKDGHSEENSLTSKPDTTGSKNAVQALGSTVTYLQRYTLKLALGIATSKDDDGSGGADPWAPLLAEMRTNKTAFDLQSWGLENADRIHNTVGVKAHFRREYAAYLDQLKHTEKGDVKAQLRASVEAETVDEPKKRSSKPYAPKQDAIEAEAFDPDKFLDDLDAAMTVCTDQDSLDEVWNSQAQEKIEAGLVFPPDQQKADDLFEKHMARLEAAS